MDAAAIRSCIVATLDADANVRKRAELQLKQVRKDAIPNASWSSFPPPLTPPSGRLHAYTRISPLRRSDSAFPVSTPKDSFLDA